MIWDCPETWMALLDGWDVDRSAPSRGLLLLKRRASRRGWGETQLTQQTVGSGEWLQVPERQGLVRLSLAVRERGGSALRRLLLRPAPIVLQALTERGLTRTYRLVATTAREGLLVDAMAVNVDDVAGLFDCCTVADRVRAVRLSGPGLKSVEPRMSVAWSAVLTDRGLVVRPALPVTDSVRIAGEPMLGLETLNTARLDTGNRRISVDSAAEAKVTLTGWAVDPEARVPARAVMLRVDDGRLEVRAAYGILREDVARHFDEPGYALSGFRGSIAVDQLGPGPHRIQVSVVSRDGLTLQLSSQAVEFDVR